MAQDTAHATQHTSREHTGEQKRQGAQDTAYASQHTNQTHR